MTLLLQLVVNGLATGMTFALISIGFALIFSITRVFHVAHGAVYLVAGYLMLLFSVMWGWSFPVAVVLTVACATVLGLAIHRGCYRVMQGAGATSLVIMIASLGLLILVQNLVAVVFGTDLKTLRTEPVRGSVDLGGVTIDALYIKAIVAGIALYGLLELFMRKTRFGTAMRAVAANPGRAQTLGIHVDRIYDLTFAVGSALAVVPAIVIGLDTGLTPNIGLEGMIFAFIAVIVGGLGSVRGAAIGGVFLGLVQSVGIWKIPSQWQESIAFGVLLLFIILRPQGFCGLKVR